MTDKKEIQKRADKKRNERLKEILNEAGWSSLSALKTAIINGSIRVPLHPDLAEKIRQDKSCNKCNQSFFSCQCD